MEISGDKQEYAEFTHETFHVLVASGEKVLVALILEKESSRELQERAFKFIDEFEGDICIHFLETGKEIGLFLEIQPPNSLKKYSIYPY